MSRIGRVEPVGLRDLWGHEATDFTTWLERNVDALADATGIELGAVEREQSVGPFSVDLTAEDGDGRPVVIENQLERSDHDHLGKLLTYLVGMQASRAIWIVADPRPEHVAVVGWLNESVSADFHLVKLQAIRIGDSEPAPLFMQIAGPSDEVHEVGRRKKQMTERHMLRYRFFEGLLAHAKRGTQLHSRIRPPHNAHWVGAGSGIAGVTFNYVVRQRDANVELYIDTTDGAENTRILDALLLKKDAIEAKFGQALEWDSTREGSRARRIGKTCTSGGYRDEDNWPEVHEELAQAMAELESALRPHLNGLR